MAIYHMQTRIIGRSKGQSAVASAAYRSGEKLFSEEDNRHKNYAGKQPEIEYSKILLPTHAPEQYQDRAKLWNAVQANEDKSNSQLAREIIIALPSELDTKENINLVEKYVIENFVNNGMVADINIHNKGDGNPHAHIMLTVRPLDERGEWGEKQKKIYQLDKDGQKIYDPVKQTYKCRTHKTTDWDKKETLEKWRENWSISINIELRNKGIDDRVTHQSYEKQGIAKIPTVHLGAKAETLEKKGVPTRQGDHNREATAINKAFDEKRQTVNRELEQLPTEKEIIQKHYSPAPEVPERPAPERPAPERPITAPPISLNERIERHTTELEKQDVTKIKPHMVNYYKTQNEALQRDAKQVTDWYYKLRSDTHTAIGNEKFQSFMTEKTATADAKIKEHSRVLENLEKNEPRKLFNKAKHEDWQRRCDNVKEEIRRCNLDKDPTRYRDEKAQFKNSVSAAEMKNRIAETLTPQERQRHEKAKETVGLIQSLDQKTKSLEIDFNKRQQELAPTKEQEQEKNKGKSRGR